MKTLTRNLLLKKPEPIEIYLSSLEVKAYITPLNSEDANALLAHLGEGKDFELNSQLIAEAVTDKNGKPLLKENDVESLKYSRADVYNELLLLCTRYLNPKKVVDDAIEHEVKNSASTRRA